MFYCFRNRFVSFRLYIMAVNESNPASRFCDVDTEPKEKLQPIQGYEKMPVVSLENAVKSLIPHVNDVERMAQMVKDYCDAPKDNLTHDESASILLYSMEWEPTNQSFCFILNTTLRKVDRGLLKPWFLYLRLIISALVKLPSEPTRFTVYRGVKMDLSAQMPKGNKIVWWAFTSCTTSVGILNNERFLGKNGSRTLFIIDCYSGKKIRNHTIYPEEEEVLFFPACQFKVMDCINRGNGLLVVYLKEIEPKYSMINPVELSKNNLPNIRPYAPAPTNKGIFPKLVQKPAVPVLPTRRLQPFLPIQQSFDALTDPGLHIKALSNNLTQFSRMPAKKNLRLPALTLANIQTEQSTVSPTKTAIQPAERTQCVNRSKDESNTNALYNGNKPLEGRETLHIDPVNICCYILITIVLRQYLRFYHCTHMFSSLQLYT